MSDFTVSIGMLCALAATALICSAVSKTAGVKENIARYKMYEQKYKSDLSAHSNDSDASENGTGDKNST